MSIVRPIIEVLSKDQAELVHKYSLQILADTGVKIESEKARKIFINSGRALVSGNRVYLPTELVEWAIMTAPHEVKMCNRKQEYVFSIGRNHKQTRFGTGVTNLYYDDPVCREIVPFRREHTAISTGLANTLSSYEIVSTPGVIKDVVEKVDLISTAEMLANTTKPLILLTSDQRQHEQCLDLVEHIAGKPENGAFIIPYFNPITPLVINDETIDKMVTTIDHGLPFIYSNYSMYGATAPITPAGCLALLNAELLAGLVLSQLIKEGTPIILGSLPASFDMSTMASLYTTQTMMLNLACAEMMDYYDLPHAGTSGSGTGWGGDILGGSTLWMNHLTSCMGKVGLVPFVGGNFDSMVFSPELVVLAEHVIKQSRVFAEGFTINDETVRPDEIANIGPGGNFLTSELTLSLFTSGVDDQKLWETYSLEKWLEEGKPKAEDILREKTIDILNNLRLPDDHEEVLAKCEEFINKL